MRKIEEIENGLKDIFAHFDNVALLNQKKF